jgi:cobalamin biosynthesis protein CobD/CbiB
MTDFLNGIVPLLVLLKLRAQLLAALIVLGYVIGEFFARGPIALLLNAGDALVVRLKKLDKPNRGVATLVYRGMIAVFMLLIPAMLAAALLSKNIPALKLFSYALLVIWFGHCFETFRTISLWRRAKIDGLPLELPGLHYLFADSHAVIRYLVARRIQGFTVGVVGGSFWYLIGGLPLMAAYLTLAAAADTYRTPVFGWAARSLFLLMDIFPRFISRILLTLASLFTPQTKPFAGLFATSARAGIASTLDIALGGPMPKGELPWVGKGTARLTPKHLQRILTMILASSVLLVLLLVSPSLDNLLTINH